MTSVFQNSDVDEALSAATKLMSFFLGEGDELDVAGKMAVEHLQTGGKLLRARLAISSAMALEVPKEQAVGWAAACELVHNGTLVHDDVQDQDRYRRGHPTVWVRHGMEQAINVGDFFLSTCFLPISVIPVPDGTKWGLARAMAAAIASVVRGQACEIEAKRKKNTHWDAYQQAVILKTSALFQLPVEGSALLGKRTAKTAQELGASFKRFGLLFQMQDDLLDLFGEKGRDKPGRDIAEGKISVLIVEHLALHPEDSDWVLSTLSLDRKQTPETEIEKIIERLHDGGALKAALSRIKNEADSLLLDPGLIEQPSLGEIAQELTEVALNPIRHLYSQL